MELVVVLNDRTDTVVVVEQLVAATTSGDAALDDLQLLVEEAAREVRVLGVR